MRTSHTTVYVITYEHDKTWTPLAHPTPRTRICTKSGQNHTAVHAPWYNFNAARTCLLVGLGHACHVQHQCTTEKKNTKRKYGFRSVGINNSRTRLDLDACRLHAKREERFAHGPTKSTSPTQSKATTVDMAEAGTEQVTTGKVDTRLHSKMVPVAWMVWT